MIAVPTFLIGLLPGYASLGVAAPALLIALRLVQGLSLGGEYPSSLCYLIESAPPGRRAFCASFAGQRLPRHAARQERLLRGEHRARAAGHGGLGLAAALPRQRGADPGRGAAAPRHPARRGGAEAAGRGEAASGATSPVRTVMRESPGTLAGIFLVSIAPGLPASSC